MTMIVIVIGNNNDHFLPRHMLALTKRQQPFLPTLSATLLRMTGRSLLVVSQSPSVALRLLSTVISAVVNTCICTPAKAVFCRTYVQSPHLSCTCVSTHVRVHTQMCCLKQMHNSTACMLQMDTNIPRCIGYAWVMYRLPKRNC